MLSWHCMEFCGVMICGFRFHQHKALRGTEYCHTADKAAGNAAVVMGQSQAYISLELAFHRLSLALQLLVDLIDHTDP